MSPQPPRSPDAKVEASESSASPTAEPLTMARFEALTKRLLKVPPEEVREVERAFAARKEE